MIRNSIVICSKIRELSAEIRMKKSKEKVNLNRKKIWKLKKLKLKNSILKKQNK
jgi:hypothetical protein